MNRKASVCLIGLIGLAGCTAPEPTASTNPPTTHSETGEDGTVMTFVSLKVPNMH